MSILLKTRNWEWRISENGINNTLFFDGKKENLLKENQYFAYRSISGKKSVPQKSSDTSVYAGEESLVFPKKITRENNILNIYFENPKLVFTLEITEKEYSIIFKMINVTPSDYNYGRLFFGCFELNENNGDIYSSAITHNIEIQAVEIPGYCVRCGAYTTHVIGDKNKACEFLVCKKEDMRQNIKDICKNLSIESVVVTTKGGAFSDECKEARLNYTEITNENVYDFEKFLEPHKHLGINLFDIGHGTVFRQGDMKFLAGTTDKFKKEFVDKLHERGMKAGLHIYGCMIAENSSYIVPKPHKDLAASDYYTLKEDMSDTSEEIFLEENTDNIQMVQGYCEKKACCFCIDDEIIVFEKRGENGRVYNLERGAFGTEKAPHKKGSVVKHLVRNFNHFHPVPGSELFFEIARKAAELYNACDFDFIYFDGLDVSHTMYDPKRLRWLPESAYETKWYYSARFVQEILKNCKKVPMVEYSMNCPAIWAARSRAGTFDTFFTGYKAAIDFHCRENEEFSHKKLLTSQLGWYDFYPMAFEYNTPYFSTYVTAYEFPEDVEYLGQKVVAYDSAISSLSYDSKKYPQMNKKRYENECVLKPYIKLKEQGCLSQETKDMLKSEDNRYKICENNGKYSFIKYERHFGYPYSFKEGENSFNVVNKFDNQKPFVRLLCTHTAEETESSFVIAKFDKEIPIIKQNRYIDLRISKDEFTDLRGNEALGIWVKGNNSDEYMNIGIFANLASRILMQNIIHLDFEGWRYFTLCEKDSNEALEMKFNYCDEAKKEIETFGYHSFYQPTPCYDKAYALTIGFTGEGKDVYIGDIKAIKPVKENIKNPSVEINGEKMTFICELAPTEYIEYKGGEKADILDVTGKVREADAVGTHVTLKNGKNTVYIRADGNGVRRIKTYIITEEK